MFLILMLKLRDNENAGLSATGVAISNIAAGGDCYSADVRPIPTILHSSVRFNQVHTLRPISYFAATGVFARRSPRLEKALLRIKSH